MRSILKLVIRLSIITGFLQALVVIVTYASQTLYSSRNASQSALAYYGTYYVFYLIAFLITILIMSVVWAKTERLIDILVGDVEENPLVINLSNVEITRLALRILGFFMVFTSLPSLFGAISYYIYHARVNSDIIKGVSPAGLSPQDVQHYVTVGASTIIGICLIFGEEKFKRFFMSVRDYVNEPDVREEEAENDLLQTQSLKDENSKN